MTVFSIPQSFPDRIFPPSHHKQPSEAQHQPLLLGFRVIIAAEFPSPCASQLQVFYLSSTRIFVAVIGVLASFNSIDRSIETKCPT